MKELKFKTGMAYDNETFRWEHIYWFEYDGKIYDAATFTLDDTEISMGWWDEIEEDHSRTLGLFTEDEVEETAHQLVCKGNPDLLTDEEFNKVVSKAIKIVADYNELKMSGYDFKK